MPLFTFWLVWLIGYCLTSIMYINLYRNEGWINRVNDFDCHWKSMENWEGTKNLDFCSCCNVPTLLRNLQEVFRVQGVTHYGPRSGFRYYNLTTCHKEDSLLSPTWGHTEQFCGFEPWEPSLVPSNIIWKIAFGVKSPINAGNSSLIMIILYYNTFIP